MTHQTKAPRTAPHVRHILFGVVLLLGMTLLAILAYPAHGAAAQELCPDEGAMPAVECRALLDLYTSTGGDGWVRADNWSVVDGTVTPCDWYGVSCSNGNPRHVTAIDLPANGLTGALPATLAELPELVRLNVRNNALDMAVTRTICKWSDTLTDVDLDYNKIRAAGNQARSCLDRIAPGWSATQTVPPADLTAVEIGADFVELTWTPIAYQDHAGGYYFALSESAGGPFTPAARTDDKQASTVRLDGLLPGRTYHVRVRTVTEPHGDQAGRLSSDPASLVFATDAQANVLLIVYFAADNDLTVYVDGLLARLTEGTLLNPSLRVVALTDRLGDENTEVWQIHNGRMDADDELLARLGVTELDTADPAQLAAFIAYARDRFPADKTVLSLLGHGVGLAPDLAWLPPPDANDPSPSPRRGIPPLPRGKDATPTDITSGSYMSTPALGEALAAATDDGADPLDLLFFDQCFAGNLDILYEVRNAADVYVASPNYAWLSAPYTRYIAEFSPNRTAEEMANAVINVYQRSLDDAHPNAIFWLRAEDIVTVAGAVDRLADSLVGAIAGDARQEIFMAAQNSNYVDTTQCGRQNLKLGPPDELLGATSFAEELKRQFGAGDDFGVSAAADQLLAALANVTGNARTGNPYIEPDELWAYDDTLTLLAPLRRDSPAAVAWRASLYRADLGGSEAAWTPDPTQTVLVGSTLSYVENGRWDDFIASWYADGLEPTVGEWCSYTPPSLVVADTVEVMPLTAVQANTLTLTWGQPADDTVARYALFGRRPGDVSWTLLEWVAPDRQSLALAGLEEGDYRFTIAALNADDVYFAKSDSIDVAVADPAGRVFLPIVLNR